MRNTGAITIPQHFEKMHKIYGMPTSEDRLEGHLRQKQYADSICALMFGQDNAEMAGRDSERSADSLVATEEKTNGH
jgi:hypothetical protein